MELQRCRLGQETAIKEIVCVDAVENWKNDSLYIYGDDMEQFWMQYGAIFTDGIYSNGESGSADLYGINYYSKEQAERIMVKVREQRPPYGQTLLDWLEKINHYNGFYVLGL